MQPHSREGRGTTRAARGLAPWLLGSAVLAAALAGGTALGEKGPRSALPEAEPKTRVVAAHPGAGLRAGLRALSEGKPGLAETWFSEVARSYPLVADHAERLRVRALRVAEQHAEVAAAAERFALQFSDPFLLADVLRMAGEAASAQGSFDTAQAHYARALSLTAESDARADLHRLRAQALEMAGQSAQAAREWLAVWRDHPTSPSAPAAAEALSRLEAHLAEPARDASAHAIRAEGLYQARENEAALEACDRALAGALPAAKVRSLRRLRAFTLFRLRRYPAAVAAFEAAGDDEEVRFWRARSLARSGRIAASIRAFETLGARPGRSLGARALFLAGTLLEGEGDAARATAHYRKVVSQAPTAGLREAARWRLGWSDYQAGRFAEAAAHFARLARDQPDPLERLRGRYWHARALVRQGAPQAEGLLAALAGEYPLSYYGWRAASLAAPTQRPRPQVSAEPPASLPESALERVRILLAAGLSEEARREITGLAKGARRLEARLTLAQLYTQNDDHHEAQHLAQNGNLERLARGPESAAEELWWFAWPPAFAEAVEPAARTYAVSPALLYAVMREESGYRPRVLSSVGARGLTQIMPETGERLASQLGLPAFQPDDLFDPATNVRLGAFYLASLLERFDGRVSAAVASYNAGPAAVGRWLREEGAGSDDEWVEAIPYDQTRSYVKRVLRSLHAYRVLY